MANVPGLLVMANSSVCQSPACSRTPSPFAMACLYHQTPAFWCFYAHAGTCFCSGKRHVPVHPLASSRYLYQRLGAVFQLRQIAAALQGTKRRGRQHPFCHQACLKPHTAGYHRTNRPILFKGDALHTGPAGKIAVVTGPVVKDIPLAVDLRDRSVNIPRTGGRSLHFGQWSPGR